MITQVSDNRWFTSKVSVVSSDLGSVNVDSGPDEVHTRNLIDWVVCLFLVELGFGIGFIGSNDEGRLEVEVWEVITT